ncbi:MAG: hypothetical protein NTY55_01175 [Flavobacteriia bacterium]|nr:hypothetical protein [Flavobacteriia bacterium]
MIYYYILISRYEQFDENKSVTHITTNLSATEIEKVYGVDFALE